jgi:hypothetical protein
MDKWSGEHTYNLFGIIKRIYKSFDDNLTGYAGENSIMFSLTAITAAYTTIVIIPILLILHTLDWIFNLYLDVINKLLSKYNDNFTVVAGIMIVTFIPIVVTFYLPNILMDIEGKRRRDKVTTNTQRCPETVVRRHVEDIKLRPKYTIKQHHFGGEYVFGGERVDSDSDLDRAIVESLDVLTPEDIDDILNRLRRIRDGR